MNKDEKPRSFIENYLQVHKIDPGPCKYETQVNMSKDSFTFSNSPKYNIPKGKTPGYFEQVI